MQIPQDYLSAIEQALQVEGVSVSTVKVKAVLANLPEDKQDFISCQFYLREYKAQNKRVPKLAALLNAAKRVIEGVDTDEPMYSDLASAIALFDKPVNSEEF